jgi:mono/diheme cytochrome c family protein
MQGLPFAIAALLSMQTPPSLELQVIGASSPVRKAPPPPAAALALYAERCAMCHGEKGRGDGPAAKGLMTKPRRFSDAIWQESEDDAHIQKAILEGGFGVNKSSAMPAHPDLKAQVSGLVQVVRSFRSPTGTVAVDVVGPEGKTVATHSTDPDARGACKLKVYLTESAHRLLVRVAGRSEPACTLEIAGAAPVATCDASASRSVAPTSPTNPAGADGPASAELSPASNPTR